MKIKLFSCLVMLLCCISLSAQTTKTVTGVVSDDKGLAIIGASIIEKGTQNGAITDLDGNYSIKVQEGTTLEISSIGYKTVEVVVGSQSVYNATLGEDTQLLDEVVVVGYGVQKKINVTGSVLRAVCLTE